MAYQKSKILYQNTEKRKSLPNIERGEHLKISLEKLNEIEFQNLEEIQNPKTSSVNTGSATILSGNKINIIRNTRESETQWSSESFIAKIARKDEEDQTRAQLSAARRSLKTNLVLLIVFLLLVFSHFIYPTIYAYVATSLLKAVMPILTTVVNFGTIKEMAARYCEYIKHSVKLRFY